VRRKKKSSQSAEGKSKEKRGEREERLFRQRVGGGPTASLRGMARRAHTRHLCEGKANQLKLSEKNIKDVKNFGKCNVFDYREVKEGSYFV